jgi:methyltransferase (TIGR00027 family)
MEKRIETRTSRTAAMTCVSRAASSLERDSHYRCGDSLAVRLLPNFLRVLIHLPLFRRLLLRLAAPRGVYEYVIARTRYVDAAVARALAEGFDQILIFGAGYDTRALRFRTAAQQARIFELDSPHTQEAKIRQFVKRGLEIPANLTLLPIDFEKESLPDKLDAAGFEKEGRTLFILEGLLMYLEPSSVRETLRTIREYAGRGSRVVFDYVQASVLRGGHTLYGEAGLVRSVARAGEGWRFGLDPDSVASFAADYGFTVTDHKCVQDLEAAYFRTGDGSTVGRINGTHCIVTVERP